MPATDETPTVEPWRVKRARRLAIARNAAREVGLDPEKITLRHDRTHGGHPLVVKGWRRMSEQDRKLYRRAVRLAIQGLEGDDHLVRCDACCTGRTRGRARGTAPCTPVALAIAGECCEAAR